MSFASSSTADQADNIADTDPFLGVPESVSLLCIRLVDVAGWARLGAVAMIEEEECSSFGNSPARANTSIADTFEGVGSHPPSQELDAGEDTLVAVVV